MRHLAITVLLTLLIGPAISQAAPSEAPASQPEARAAIGSTVAELFTQPRGHQGHIRRQLEGYSNLPAMLASLLQDDDPVIRRNSLMLLRDNYGDWPVVSAVQQLLRTELARGKQSDPYVIMACCEILSDWPQWDSIPVLMTAVKSKQVGQQDRPHQSDRPAKIGVWREADTALRVVSGEWPLPEPDSSAAPAEPNSPQDIADRQTLEAAWAQWWAQSGACSVDSMPQVRAEFTWRQASAQPKCNKLDAASVLLWVRPTGSVFHCRTAGRVDRPDQPSWAWGHRTRRQTEFHLNGVQTDYIRTVAQAIVEAPTDTCWAMDRPADLPVNWAGSLRVSTVFGESTVRIADPATPDAVRPPAPVAEALAELVNMMNSQ